MFDPATEGRDEQLVTEAGSEGRAVGGHDPAEEVLKRLTVGPVAASSAAVPASPAPDHPLTSRELEVLRLVAKGLGDKEIAGRLHLSGHTVHRHISNIRTKLGLPSRSAAVAWAAQNGLL